MAKKRRDKERDSSTVSKIAKVAALTVSVGAAYFSIPGLNKKLTSEYIPALSNHVPATKGVIPSFLNMKMGFNEGYISYIDLENLTFIDNKLSSLGKQEIEVKRTLKK